MKDVVRTRFAPSPTGFLHVGGVRTALFAWLVANQSGGKFILRIEDTDRSRHVEESEKHITDSLQWLGIRWDEGPYRQSELLDVYKKWGQRLVAAGRAYADPTTEEELDKMREAARLARKPFLYRDNRPDSPPKWDGSQPLRFKSEPKAYEWNDEVMGSLSTGPEAVDDFILIKSDGFPTYNFAHIVDDNEMQISHVIRSQEFLPSVPKFLNLYEALEIDYPKLATLPYVLAASGNKKLSKRDGAKDVLDYKREGYLPEAIVNFLATLGWNDGSDKEIFSVEELIKQFSLKRVHRGGARFDEQRLEWMNGHYIRQKPIDELYMLTEDFWPNSAANHPEAHKKAVLALVQERLKYLAEIPNLTNFFFEDLPVDLGLIDKNKQLAKIDRSKQISLLEKTQNALIKNSFTVDGLSEELNNLLTETNQKPVVLFSLIRIATTWAPASPGLAETLALLGKVRCLDRLSKAIEALNT